MSKENSKELEDLDRYLSNIIDEHDGDGENRRDLRIRAARHLLEDSEVVYVEGSGWIAAYLDEVERFERIAIAAREVLYWSSKASTSPSAFEAEDKALEKLYKLADQEYE